jgi:hypothetical protein
MHKQPEAALAPAPLADAIWVAAMVATVGIGLAAQIFLGQIT